MRAEYDFTGGVHGKHYRAMQGGYTITIHKADGTTLVKEVKPVEGAVILEPDVRKCQRDIALLDSAHSHPVEKARRINTGVPNTHERRTHTPDNDTRVAFRAVGLLKARYLHVGACRCGGLERCCASQRAAFQRSARCSSRPSPAVKRQAIPKSQPSNCPRWNCRS
jgi:hypothetical protein